MIFFFIFIIHYLEWRSKCHCQNALQYHTWNRIELVSGLSLQIDSDFETGSKSVNPLLVVNRFDRKLNAYGTENQSFRLFDSPPDVSALPSLRCFLLADI